MDNVGKRVPCTRIIISPARIIISRELTRVQISQEIFKDIRTITLSLVEKKNENKRKEGIFKFAKYPIVFCTDLTCDASE